MSFPTVYVTVGGRSIGRGDQSAEHSETGAAKEL